MNRDTKLLKDLRSDIGDTSVIIFLLEYNLEYLRKNQSQ